MSKYIANIPLRLAIPEDFKCVELKSTGEKYWKIRWYQIFFWKIDENTVDGPHWLDPSYTTNAQIKEYLDSGKCLVIDSSEISIK